MYQEYSILLWMCFFYLYSFLGWCWESAYVSAKTKKLTNRGFLRGPFLPIYGCGATMMFIVSIPFQHNIFLTYVAGCIGATALEYVAGVGMEALFKVRYWDYSDKKFNFQGHICLSSSLCWGFFTILMTTVIHKPFEAFFLFLPYKLVVGLTLFTTALFCADLALSVKAAIDLRDLLVKVEQIRNEMARIQKRLDVIIAVAGEGVEQKKEGIVENIAGIKNGIVGSLADRKNAIEYRLERIKVLHFNREDSVADEVQEIKTRYAVIKETARRLTRIKDFFQRDMIMSNDMTSTEYGASLDDIKEYVLYSAENPDEEDN